MSEPTNPPSDPESAPSDPLLDSGSYIDPARNDSAAAASDSPLSPNPEFAPGVVIAAEPISMYVPGETSAEPTPRPAPRRRTPDEMSKPPGWLPEGWTIELKVRASGATAGHIDRYYVEPKGQRKFRSKIEVFHFLETGSKPSKRKQTSETDNKPSKSPASQKQKKSNTKQKKSDATQSPQAANGVTANNAQ